jgi:hypothetical protein
MEKDNISRYCKTISPEHQGRAYQVGEGYISRFYKTMSPEDQRGFNRWLTGERGYRIDLSDGTGGHGHSGLQFSPVADHGQ